ncbi:MAG: MotE family protein [Pseudomonadota bacterium]|jgi:flagellar motility protein MotE (MotC chaperone)
MSQVPRILPLVAVAIGGVIAVKAVTDLNGAQDLLSLGASKARAEGAKADPAKPAPVKPGDAAGQAMTTAAKPPAPVCAPSAAQIAKEAGLSPGELQVLQSLGQRRGELDDRERALSTQIQLIAAAETKVDGKLKALNDLKGEIKGLLGQIDSQEQQEVDRLVIVYSKMKPADAAAIMAQLDDKVRIPVAAKMKEAALAAVLSKMAPADAKKITESLAHRFAVAKAAADAINNPAAAAATPPAQTAAAQPAKAAPKPAAKPAAKAAGK